MSAGGDGLGQLEMFVRRGQAAQRAVDEFAQRLELRKEAGGWRHYIGDVAIHCGDPIAAFLNGAWVHGRYEATWSAGLPRAVFYGPDDRVCRITAETPVKVAAGGRYSL